MDTTDPRADLAFVRRTLEQAGTYSNLPPAAYFATGSVAIGAGLASYQVLGPVRSRQLDTLSAGDAAALAAIWVTAMILAVLAAVVSSRRAARSRQRAAWTSLGARMFLSQVPLFCVSGAISLVLWPTELAHRIPALWLLHYGVMVHSFSYFTGRIHRMESWAYLGLGALALLGPPPLILPAMIAGFGIVHLAAGLLRLRSAPDS